MALTVTTSKTEYVGTEKCWRGTITPDASYPTGGESFTPAQVGFVNFSRVIVTPSEGYVGEYDAANQKVLFYWVDTTTDGAPLAEVAAETDLSGSTFLVAAYE